MVLGKIGRSLGIGKRKQEKQEEPTPEYRSPWNEPASETTSSTATTKAPAPEMPPSEPAFTDTSMEAPAETSATGTVSEPSAESQPELEAAPSQETYVVQAGDSLSAIAQRFYGDANAYMRIFDANRDKLDNPDMIHPGQELVIPR
jgi:nucleoid-associated protein YgaU